jgi:hypothetical protein
MFLQNPVDIILTGCWLFATIAARSRAAGGKVSLSFTDSDDQSAYAPVAYGEDAKTSVDDDEDSTFLHVFVGLMNIRSNPTHAYKHEYMHTYIQCIQTYMHTYTTHIHTHTHTHN